MRELGKIAALALVCSLAVAREPVRARHGMVVAEEETAADVGVEALRKGGNAIDAAVAVAFALAVTHPGAGNIGGGGFMLIRFADGKTTFVDFRERAPKTATRDMYLGPDGAPTRDSLEGWRAAGVPGTVRGLELAHRKYGTKKWADLVRPAIRLAKRGYEVSYRLAESMRANQRMEKFPESKRIFLKDGDYYAAGDLLRQPELAATLERIAKRGAAEFYEGRTARVLADEMARNGGLITLEDLKDYKAVERQPLTGTYRGYEIVTAPPPSSGGIGVLEMLGMLEGSDYAKAGFGAAQTIHFEVEVMRRFFADRAEHLGDPDFGKIPVQELLDAGRLSKLRASIDRAKATPSAEVGTGKTGIEEKGHTTHFSIVDAQGNAVSVTYTINDIFGSGVTVPGLGFLLNDEMDDFTARPGAPNGFGLVQGERNAIEPGKRPLSSMTPTIVARDGKPFLVLGAPGGPRIINGVLEVLLNVVDFGMNVQEAVDAPRFHHQWLPDQISMEKEFSPDTVARLEAMGHKIAPIKNVASVQAIEIEGGWLEGANDGRAGGKAAGY